MEFQSKVESIHTTLQQNAQGCWSALEKEESRIDDRSEEEERNGGKKTLSLRCEGEGSGQSDVSRVAVWCDSTRQIQCDIRRPAIGKIGLLGRSLNLLGRENH